MYLDDTWSRNFIVVVIINRGERGINENTVLLCEELLEKKEEEEERKKERKGYTWVSYFNDLYTELFIVRIAPLVEADLFSLLPIHTALLQMTFRQRQP